MKKIRASITLLYPVLFQFDSPEKVTLKMKEDRDATIKQTFCLGKTVVGTVLLSAQILNCYLMDYSYIM